MTESVTDRPELMSDPAGADTKAPDSKSCLNMEFSSNSMTINSIDKDYPLNQVLQLCSTLVGKGCDFSISLRIKDSFFFLIEKWEAQASVGKEREPLILSDAREAKSLRKKNTGPSLGALNKIKSIKKQSNAQTWVQ